MDLRREKSPKCRATGIFFIAALICAAAIAVILFSDVDAAYAHAELSATAQLNPSKIDKRAAPAKVGILTKFITPNAPDQFSYEIKKKLVYSGADAQAELRLKNPLQNRYLMALELVLEDSDAIILRTGYLLPGQIIEKAALDKPLPAGEYQAQARISAVDSDGKALLRIIEQPVTLIVEP